MKFGEQCPASRNVVYVMQGLGARIEIPELPASRTLSIPELTAADRVVFLAAICDGILGRSGRSEL